MDRRRCDFLLRGYTSTADARLLERTEAALLAGIAAAQPEARIGDIVATGVHHRYRTLVPCRRTGRVPHRRKGTTW